MQMQIESTNTLTTIDGVPVRLWEGVTAGGIPCKVYVHRIAVREDQDASQFAGELAEQAKPAIRPAGMEPQPIPLRHVL
jgi:hypothetical protein